MIIKEYDLEEERRNHPYSVHRVNVEDKDDGWISCKVEYDGKFYTVSYMKEIFGNLSPEDLIGIAARHIANKV